MGDVAPEGILYEAGRLWVAEPFLNQVTRLRPNPDLTDEVVEDVITSDRFQTPSRKKPAMLPSRPHLGCNPSQPAGEPQS